VNPMNAGSLFVLYLRTFRGLYTLLVI